MLNQYKIPPFPSQSDTVTLTQYLFSVETSGKKYGPQNKKISKCINVITSCKWSKSVINTDGTVHSGYHTGRSVSTMLL